MNYYVDLFSPETARAFERSHQDITGFRITQQSYVEKNQLGPGDRFICYVTRIQRFVGVLELTSKSFVDMAPIFSESEDPFVLRFQVKPVVWLPLEKALPIREDFIWNALSFTKNLEKSSNNWTYRVFASPRLWPKEDAAFLEKILIEQARNLKDFSFTEEEEKKLRTQKIRVSGKKEVAVSVPDNETDAAEPQQATDIEQRESLKVQGILSQIGEKLEMKIWLPRNDRAGVLKSWTPHDGTLLEQLPLVFDELTLKTIRNIDVLWIRGRSIVRAFEVEDKTSIYSGILRMADLLALQPMLDIKIHIVAPTTRREEVFKQISRPVFAVMEKGPLSELCSYISYDSVQELAKEKRLEFMNDMIVDEFSEAAED